MANVTVNCITIGIICAYQTIKLEVVPGAYDRVIIAELNKNKKINK